MVNHELHVISKKVVDYAKKFPSPVIVVEKLTGIREKFKESKKLDRRFHSLPFRRLQSMIEYKAKINGIKVVYINPRNTSRTCHRCGHVARTDGREYRRKCGVVRNRDLNASINVARASTRGTGRG
ncbi:hypothetical protein HS1genome_1214 [Sulfodiicoccus acidiphilus]|nr:RNA-guided endonuclease TnpB family protein [Sulfodiicoccus acidiphilus]BBD72825.1 hypothetical protein HS1genome_1214 [Sulfodiicoccus acidiphilus]